MRARGWIVDVIGEWPAEPDRRAAWDLIVDRVVHVRTNLEVPDEAHNLLGLEPPSRNVCERATWMVARRSIEEDLRELNASNDQGLDAVPRGSDSKALSSSK